MPSLANKACNIDAYLFFDVSNVFLSRQLKKKTCYQHCQKFSEVISLAMTRVYQVETPGGNICLAQGQAYFVISSLLPLCFLMGKSCCSSVETVWERN